MQLIENGINEISKEMMREIIENRMVEGRFINIDKNRNTFICCDNRTSDAWVEEFESLSTALSWLNDEFEMNDFY